MRSQKVCAALIQARVTRDKDENIARHVALVENAAAAGAQIICLQELFYTPYFPYKQDDSRFAVFEPVPGPTVRLMQELAARLRVVLIVPLPEMETAGVYYNTAVVIEADGEILGRYRKVHLPHLEGFYEKFYFRSGNLGYPVFKTSVADIGIVMDYDRFYPEVPRILALKGAQILFNPCTTVMDLSRYAWFIVQRAHAVVNNLYVGTSNRVGAENESGIYYGTSYFCTPRGEIAAQGSQEEDDIVIAELDLGLIEAERSRWNFFVDRRPSSYADLVKGPLE
ncbi:MAG TPA: nitrilase-related carbon-nitrogen hydrolase [Spirochaetia bacterium]|nr:nitrilase-related carbon-nitrogen hydrolase [Spirochaetia bacterium]